MPSLSEHDDDPQPDRGHRGRLVPVVVVILIVIFVILHLTGVIGPGGH
ncbi:MAG: hypothetical protein ACR2HD_00165 [Solirubrobacteraceae bacterium]